MTDTRELEQHNSLRELLELAAVAMGYEPTGEGYYRKSLGNGHYENFYWNPADNDGDSIRTCDALLIDVDYYGRARQPDGLNVMAFAFEEDGSSETGGHTDSSEEYVKHHNNSRGAARRMAVLRVAAEIGRRKREAK